MSRAMQKQVATAAGVNADTVATKLSGADLEQKANQIATAQSGLNVPQNIIKGAGG